MSEQLSDVTNSLTETVNGAKESVSNTLNDFSSSAVVNANSSFLDSNGLIAKFVFLILVLLAFLALLYLGIQLIAYFTQPSGSPYLVYGLLPGTTSATITQDPTKTGSIPVLRSNNATTGIEFTWSVWLFVDPLNSATDDAVSDSNAKAVKYHTIFVKGDGKPSKVFPYGINQPNNGPGVYLYRELTNSSGADSTLNTNVLKILIDTVQAPSSVPSATSAGIDAQPFANQSEIIDIKGIPIDKWFYLVIRCTNTYIDVYINGVIAQRLQLTSVPKQNSNNVNVCTNGGFSGNLSNLQYFNYALSAIQINSIFSAGPNLTPSSFMSNASKASNPQYLSSSWYNY
jgi:hypothetical protein